MYIKNKLLNNECFIRLLINIEQKSNREAYGAMLDSGINICHIYYVLYKSWNNNLFRSKY